MYRLIINSNLLIYFIYFLSIGILFELKVRFKYISVVSCQLKY